MNLLTSCNVFYTKLHVAVSIRVLIRISTGKEYCVGIGINKIQTINIPIKDNHKPFTTSS